MTDKQKQILLDLLLDLYEDRRGHLDQFHHGDCIGADTQAHDIVAKHFPHVAFDIHPPTDSTKRAFCRRTKTADVTWTAQPYLKRNQEIVHNTTILIATPDGPERLRSGTWSTVRYARRLKRKIFIIDPDGNLTIKNDNKIHQP